MALVLLDSSVWVSFLTLEDVRHQEAQSLLRENFDKENTILLPDLIYAEILNVSSRAKRDLDYQHELAKSLQSLSPFVRFVLGNETFWFRYVPQNIARVNLKTSDALVCCYANFLRVQQFHTFDKKLQRAFLKSRG